MSYVKTAELFDGVNALIPVAIPSLYAVVKFARKFKNVVDPAS